MKYRLLLILTAASLALPAAAGLLVIFIDLTIASEMPLVGEMTK